MKKRKKKRDKFKPKISDHAIVRYIERVWGLSREKLENSVCPPELWPVVMNSAIAVPVHDEDGEVSHILRCRQGVVRTVFPPGMKTRGRDAEWKVPKK